MARRLDTGDDSRTNKQAVDLAEEEQIVLASRHHAQVTVHFFDGNLLSGTLSVGQHNRVSDVLNSDKDFLVLVDEQRKAHILNKRYILKVTEKMEKTAEEARRERNSR